MTQQQAVVNALQKLTQHYDKCQAELELLAPQLVDVDSRMQAYGQLTTLLEAIDSHQQTYTTILRQWQSPGFVPSSECRQWKITAQASLESLLKCVQQIEEQAEHTKSHLMPSLNLAARDQQARSAYQRASSHGE